MKIISYVVIWVFVAFFIVHEGNQALAQENLGKVEIACADYNTGNGYVMKTAPISRAYGTCGPRYTHYHASTSFVSNDGSTYVVGLWFSRTSSIRGYSAIDSLGVYKIDPQYSQSLGALMDGLQCGTILIADNKTIAHSSTRATQSGYSYPESFACSVKIIPGRI